MRILEIGPTPVVKAVYPAETTFINISSRALRETGESSFDFSLFRLRQIMGLIRDPSFDAIFVDRAASQRTRVGLNALIRLVYNRRVAKRGVPIVRIFGDRVLRFGAAAPIILFDPSDAPYMTRHDRWLWRRAKVIFKRELPMDRWQLFMLTAHGDLPTPRFRRKAAYRAIVEKVRPISLGLMTAGVGEFASALPTKRTDVFFAGAWEANSWLRETGFRELEALRDRGWSIDLARERLTREEFLRRCAEARLVWSPHGFGHDAFRHYEAGACGSVPLINRSPIEQYAPFRDGETAVFYDPELGGLTAAVERALARRDELAAMGLAARAHTLAHHSLKARVDHMLSAVMKLDGA